MRVDFTGGFTLIDEDDYGLVADGGLTLDSHGYVQIYRDRRRHLLHRVVLGNPTSDVDHINRIKHDNRRCNLRLASRQLNAVNRIAPTGVSGVRGVTPVANSAKNPWQAHIKVDGRPLYLGVFPTVEEAAEVRRLAEIHFFGEECPRTEDLESPHRKVLEKKEKKGK